jgi:cation transport protein ChaC
MIRGGYRPIFLSVATPQGEVTALAFAANPSHADHVGELPIAETAAMIACANGILGTNRQYLTRVTTQLACLGIEDDYLRRLAQQVESIAAPATDKA